MTDTKDNLKSKKTWSRLPFIILYAICFNVAEIVLVAIVVVQFVSTLVSGSPLSRLQRFGSSLSAYLQEVAQFLTYARNDKPYPLNSWPDEKDFSPDEPEVVIITPDEAPTQPPSVSPVEIADEKPEDSENSDDKPT